MSDRVWILAGLAGFVAVLCAPIWHVRLCAKPSAKVPELVLPVNQKECVAPIETMRARHMQLLIGWREDVVRHGNRSYVAYNGKVYEKSLTSTCLGCHNRAGFCDRCHAYSGVSATYCWNCHNEPQTAMARSAR
jgi:hypothetical protein